MYLYQKTEQEKQNYRDALKKTSVFLARVAALIRSKRFMNWYASNEARFEWAIPALFDKLRADLMFQVHQALPSGLRKAGDGEKLIALAEMCEAIALDIETKHDIRNTKKEKSFSVPKGADFSDLLFAFASSTEHTGMVKDLSGTFYVWNAITSLITYVRARETLSRDTGFAPFERALSELDAEYLLAGYPHDLLAHDAHDIRAGVPVRALILRNGYCSTHLVQRDAEMVELSDSRVIYFNQAVKAA